MVCPINLLNTNKKLFFKNNALSLSNWYTETQPCCLLNCCYIVHGWYTIIPSTLDIWHADIGVKNIVNLIVLLKLLIFVMKKKRRYTYCPKEVVHIIVNILVTVTFHLQGSPSSRASRHHLTLFWFCLWLRYLLGQK